MLIQKPEFTPQTHFFHSFALVDAFVKIFAALEARLTRQSTMLRVLGKNADPKKIILAVSMRILGKRKGQGDQNGKNGEKWINQISREENKKSG